MAKILKEIFRFNVIPMKTLVLQKQKNPLWKLEETQIAKTVLKRGTNVDISYSLILKVTTNYSD